MPLTSDVSQNVQELYKDNKRKGKARGDNGRPRSREQIIAIAENAARNTRGKEARNKTPAEVYSGERSAKRSTPMKKKSSGERFVKHFSG